MSSYEIGGYIGTFLIGFLLPLIVLVLYWKGGNFFRVALKRYKLKSNKYLKPTGPSKYSKRR